MHYIQLLTAGCYNSHDLSCRMLIEAFRLDSSALFYLFETNRRAQPKQTQVSLTEKEEEVIVFD